MVIRSQANVYCHTCETHRLANWNSTQLEYNCTICQGSFVEEENQGIENFVAPDNRSNLSVAAIAAGSDVIHSTATATDILENPTATPQSSDSESATVDQDQLVNQILERLLGVPATQLQAVDSSNQINQRSRPLGIVIRQSVNPLVTTQIGRVTEDNSEGAGGLARSLFGLLQSISAARHGRIGEVYSNADALSNTQFEQYLHHILMNENSHSGAPPASQELIDGLKRQTISEEADLGSFGECHISQEAFDVGDIMVSLPCGHNYKEEPITHWLKMHRTCPVCRVSIAPESS